MGIEFLHVDRQTDMKLVVAFRKFASAPRNIVAVYYIMYCLCLVGGGGRIGSLCEDCLRSMLFTQFVLPLFSTKTICGFLYWVFTCEVK